MSRGELNISRWLEAHCDRTAGVTTLPRNAELVDVAGDGDYRLIITDLNLQNDSRSRLKVYKGSLTADIILPDVPNSLITFQPNQLEPRIPAVAVACGSDMFIYKNNKPFYKFRVPSTPILPLEAEFWKKCSEGEMTTSDINNAIDQLKALPFDQLSGRSQDLLSGSPTRIQHFIAQYADKPPIKESPITCMTTLNKTSPDKYAVSCPVIATEFGNIYFLDPQTLTILHQANTCSKKATPFIMKSIGLFDVEFRIVIACREGHICILRRGWLEGKSIIQLVHDIIDIVIIPGDNFIVVATADQMLNCYTKRGQNLWSTKLTSAVTCLCLVPLQHLSLNLVAVGLRGGAIHLYQGRQPVDYSTVPDTPSVITFGQLGQEENVMVIITIAGTMTFKILKRTADFNLPVKENVPILQSTPLPLPKRSKLFLEQSLREKLTALDMHQKFQQDLIRLRLTSARELVSNVTKQSSVGNDEEQIKLTAQVLGLGPKFTVILTLENMSSDKSLKGLTATFHAKPSVYNLSTNIIKVPLMPPSFPYKMGIKVEEIMNEVSEEQQADISLQGGSIIRVYINRGQMSQPILAATVNMPPTEII